MKYSKLLSILFIAGTLTLGLSVSQSVFGSDADGPPGDPHTNPVDDFPPKSPQGDEKGNPHHGNSPPPGYGDPHTGSDRGSPHIGDNKGNPHAKDPRPAHSLIGGNPFEATSSASHGEPTFTDFPGEPVASDFPGEPAGNDFPGEPFSNVSFGES